MYKYLIETVLSILLDIYPEVKLLNYNAILLVIFSGTSILFSMEGTPFHIPTNDAQGLQFVDILASTGNYFFNNSHPNGYEVLSHCSFDVHFSND